MGLESETEKRWKQIGVFYHVSHPCGQLGLSPLGEL